MSTATTKPILPALPGPLLEYLGAGAPGLLLTTGADGYPSSAYTWVVGLDPTRLRFAVDLDGSAMGNLRRSGLAALHVMGPGNLDFLMKGKARQVRDRIAAAPEHAMALYEMELMGARDQSWPGVVVRPLVYDWPADRRVALASMERAVFAEMRS
jgi:hypothetical protein